jgi:aspartyl-tRNA(Asn)/glutamyl-tRNA(Gln) amidotransferase subunit C
MTQITRDDVLHLAQLSSLELSEAEINDLQKDLGNIIGYINKLSELDTTGVEPTYQVTGLSNIWRDDEVINYGVTREELLARAPEQTDSQVKVPKVL